LQRASKHRFARLRRSLVASREHYDRAIAEQTSGKVARRKGAQ
jgi:hypothetical protein